MSEERERKNQPPIKLLSFAELERRYNLSHVHFLPAELSHLGPGEVIELKSREFVGHPCPFPDSPNGWVRYDQEYTLPGGQWEYLGFRTFYRGGTWKNREGKRVVGGGVRVAVFKRLTGGKRVTLAFLVKE